MERKLTGKWYIKKRFLGFKIMVEVFYNKPILSYSQYEEARKGDLIELGIHIL